jgi:hypothetical protein
MFLEQDLEQWPCVLEVNAMHSRLRSDGGTSVRELADFLTEKLGFTISRDRVPTMLKNPMYVTGMAHVTYEGTAYPIRPIELVNPLPVEVFELNQSLMSAVKGRQHIHPLGYFLLNTIDFRHEACQHVIDDKQRPVRLRSEGGSYRHNRRCPRGPRADGKAEMCLAQSQRGISKETALRLALGRAEALVSGRVVARTRTKWVTVMSAAIDDGYTSAWLGAPLGCVARTAPSVCVVSNPAARGPSHTAASASSTDSRRRQMCARKWEIVRQDCRHLAGSRRSNVGTS